MRYKSQTVARVVIILLSIIPLNLFAQVTIGSALPPSKGALLDLKQEDKNGANSQKGILMPRVKLKSLQPTSNDLSETIENANNENSWELAEHIGLIVYNIADPVCPTIPNGLYIWDGKQWKPLQNQIKIIDLPTPSSNSNCYVMKPHSRLAIPVKQGYDIWNTYKSNGITPTAAEIKQGHVLDISSVNNLSGILSASIVWTEDSDWIECGINNVYIDNPNAGENACLIVETGNKYGNALIAVHIGSSGTETDPVLWQWHIWIPEEEPQALSPTTGTSASWTFMNMNLGAINNIPITYNPSTPSTLNAGGLYYQWGRPTPIKQTSKINTYLAESNKAEQKNMTKAFQSSDFIAANNNGKTYDWYSNNNGSADQWLTRWGDGTNNDTGSKTLLDPCPSGWRVPAYKNGVSPWYVLKSGGDNTYVLNQGYTFTNTGYNYYSGIGYRTYQGAIDGAGRVGYYWSATYSQPTLSSGNSFYFGFNLNTGALVSPGQSRRANAMSIRCVKE